MRHAKTTTVASLLALSLFAVPGIAKDRDNPTNDVKGVVHDESGKVVSNASVKLLHRAKNDELEEVDTVETNDKGQFHFEKVQKGTYVVVAMSGKKQLRDRTTITVTDNDISGIDFKLRKGDEEADEKAAKKSVSMNYASVHGQARYAKSDFVKNGEVKLLSGQGTNYKSMRVIDTVETDSEGNFTFKKVEQGDYTIVVTKGKSEGTHKITINPKEKTEDVDIKMND